ncbi:hypothetical protein A4X06_0g5441 [Tilletia controversa]|uniref:Stc1 domain-containing protein n=1 Tax=Tilletia controversa TaxID=13291 RepID=A0A8X7SVV4_9BASI|nr:hypothetical protein A4X06_0g5441 [Tilletia controversa]
MCEHTSVTILCAICQVNVVDRRLEQQPCGEVQQGRICPKQASMTAGLILYRQDVGSKLCDSCTAQAIQERGEEGRSNAVSPLPSDANSAAASRARSERISWGDQELKLKTQWRWDDRFDRPESSIGSPTTDLSSPSTPADGRSQATSETGHADTGTGSRSSSQSSDLGNSTELAGQGLSGDRNLNLRSARYWE